MTTPIPTPADIIDPQPGALEPTSTAWLFLAVLTILFWFYLRFIQRKPSPQPLHSTLQALVNQLRLETSQPHTSPQAERVVKLARCIVSPYTEHDTSSMTSDELRSLAQSLEQSTHDNFRSLAQILPLIADIEEQAYAPKTCVTQEGDTRSSMITLATLLEEHTRRFKPT